MASLSEHDGPVPFEGFGGKILGERISRHVRCAAVEESDYAGLDAFPESVHPVVDVF